MNIHEHQAKEILRKYGAPVSNGVVIFSLDEISKKIEELNEYYLPCKSKIYLKNLTEKKCITVLRQFIKYHNYKCIAMEKSVKGKKQTTYCLMYHNNDTLKSPVASEEENREFILNFDM